ncbi:MAG: AraC family transcriptional regulator [Ruminococcus sp.]|nr:AraC family transcriptional regulator [Ruminococcus sp.]
MIQTSSPKLTDSEIIYMSCNSTVTNARLFIDKNYTDHDLSLGTVADAVGLSPAYLSALFKRETGSNLSEYITFVRIEHSKELLGRTRKLFYEVADSVGFRDYRYFSQIFKRHTGMTPRQYQSFART